MTSGPGINFPYKRRMEVTFTNLKGGGEVTYVSTGRMDGLRISAKIRKNLASIPASNLLIYNLDKSTRSSFVRNETKIHIKAGWDNGPRSGLKHAYYGEVFSAISHRSGTDIVTSINSLGFMDSILSTRISKSWGKGVPVRNVVEKIAGEIPNIELEQRRLAGITGEVGSGGWPASGDAKTELDKLASAYGFSWTVIDGKFQAVNDATAIGQTTTIEDPYLGSVNPILSGPLSYGTGLTWDCLFDATLTPGYFATINSKMASEYNGTYKVLEVAHNLDCFARGGSFITRASSFIIPPVN